MSAVVEDLVVLGLALADAVRLALEVGFELAVRLAVGEGSAGVLADSEAVGLVVGGALWPLRVDEQLCTIEMNTKAAASVAQPLARLLKLKRLNHPVDESIDLILGVATPLGFKNA